MPSAGENWETGASFFRSFLALPLVPGHDFLYLSSSWRFRWSTPPPGTGLSGGQRGACNEPLRADCGQEADCTYPRHDLPMSHANKTIKQKKKRLLVTKVQIEDRWSVGTEGREFDLSRGCCSYSLAATRLPHQPNYPSLHSSPTETSFSPPLYIFSSPYYIRQSHLQSSALPLTPPILSTTLPKPISHPRYLLQPPSLSRLSSPLTTLLPHLPLQLLELPGKVRQQPPLIPVQVHGEPRLNSGAGRVSQMFRASSAHSTYPTGPCSMLCSVARVPSYCNSSAVSREF